MRKFEAMKSTEQISVEDYRKMRRSETSKKHSYKGSDSLRKVGIALMQDGVNVVFEHAFHPERKWRFDMAIPEYKIAVEYEGVVAKKSRHTTIKGYTEDCEKYNEAQQLGWRVIRVTAKNVGGVYAQVSRMLIRGKR